MKTNLGLGLLFRGFYSNLGASKHSKLDKHDTSSIHISNAPDLNMKNVLVLSKMSRYEFEKKRLRGKNENEEDLKRTLARRGSNYTALLERHDIHKRHLENLINSLEKQGIKTKVVQRLEYKVDNINWADIIMSAGGDGTFLLAASKLTDPGKPLIGFNTDPYSSEGLLCLPKRYTEDTDKAVEMLTSRKFSWLHRQRINVRLSNGDEGDLKPVDLENQQLLYPEYRFLEDVKEMETHRVSTDEVRREGGKLLPFLALNEVFIGESLSARVSYYELSIDGSPMMKQKSSGIVVSTGTGSTSWYFSGSRLSSQCVTDILRLARDELGVSIDIDNNTTTINNIVDKFNNNLVFTPSAKTMGFVVKDMIRSATFVDTNPRGFAKSINMRSRCWDACVVIDGSISYQFNDGASVELSINPQDALLTILPPPT